MKLKNIDAGAYKFLVLERYPHLFYQHQNIPWKRLHFWRLIDLISGLYLGMYTTSNCVIASLAWFGSYYECLGQRLQVGFYKMQSIL